jgi:hypothetical protein
MMRIILDTNLWSSIGDEMVASSFDALMKSQSLQVVVPPSILVEVLQLPKSEARDRIIRALAKGPRYRLPTEAQSMSDEIVSEVRRTRPAWMRSMPDTARVWSLNNSWTKRIWRAALEDSGPMHEYETSYASLTEALVRAQRVQRRDYATSSFTVLPLTALTVTPDPDNPRSRLPGWPGEPVEAWRVSCCVLFWHQLAVIGGRAILTKEEATFADWVGAYVDLSKLRSSPEDFTRFWLYDVNRDALPRNWLRWAVNLAQLEVKVTHGNPADEQHSTYLLDSDLFLTADARYVSVLEMVRKSSPFKFAKSCLVSGDRDIPIIDRLEASLHDLEMSGQLDVPESLGGPDHIDYVIPIDSKLGLPCKLCSITGKYSHPQKRSTSTA